ncbi:MAG TPA: hypothetical protein DDX04_03490, partial [Massilia sp.]|nr:hypothetical protein [Massilia sp.]
QRLDAVGGAGHAQFGPGLGQLRSEVIQQMRFVVGDQGAGGVDGVTFVSGSSRREVKPQGWVSINCS